MGLKKLPCFLNSCPELVLCLLALVACGCSSNGASISPGQPKALHSIAVTCASTSIRMGGTLQLTATGAYSDGSTQNITSGVTWSSSNTDVATINGSGVASALAAGSSTITATLNGVSGTVALTVAAASVTLRSIAVTPATPGIAAGVTQQFTATGTYSDGSAQNITSAVTWSSSNAGVASINGSGTATAISAGSSTITATLNGVSGSATLTVTAAAVTLQSIAVTPAAPTIAAGASQQFAAIATYSDKSTANVTSAVAWSNSNSAAATINASGLAAGVAGGSSTITATLNGVSGTAVLTVTAPVRTLQSIAVAPSAPSIVAGTTQQFTATATYSDKSTANVTSSVTWASSNTAAATINGSGLATGVAAGSSAITATLNGVSGTAMLTVTAAARTLQSIAVTPSAPNIAPGSTQQFTATATYSDKSTADVTTSVTWSSSNTAAVTINASGLATGVAAGTSTITAASGSVSGTSALTVTSSTGAGTVNITTWHVDNNRTGLNANETILTPLKVDASSFGKLFSYLVDGYVYGEPLIMSNVTISGAKHDLLYVATENDSVYAFDADNYGTGAPLWKVSLLQSGETPLTGAPIQPVEGVTSTPVIDSSTNTLYVTSAQTSTATGGTFRLHALDITTGAEKFGGPVTVTASVPGTGTGGTTETLTTSCIQRTALLLANGNIYMGFGSCHSGWFLAYNATTLKQVGAFNSSPILNGEGTYASAGGIWMGGAGPVADSSGNVYISTGNGPWNGTNAFGDSVLKFPPTPASGANGTMQPGDYFTPSNYQYMNCDDADLGSGGLILIPGTSTLIAGGKTGTMYLLNSTSLGHETSNDAGALQQQVWGANLPSGDTYQDSCTDSAGVNYANVTSYEIFGTPAYFNGGVYLGVTPTSSTAPGGNRQFTYSGTLTPGADTIPSIQQGTRGTTPFISANGSTGGIVWMIDQGFPLQNSASDPSNPGAGMPPTNATLRAYSVDSYPNELYDSSQNSGDKPGYGIKFTSPVVANGKVYISTGHDLTTTANPRGEIDVYGLK